MTTNDLINEGIGLFNAKKYTEAIQKLNQALDSISDKTGNLQQQINAQFWLGYCYLELALQTKNVALFHKASEHLQSQALIEQLGGENNIQQQVNTQCLLGYCYLEQALQTKEVVLFNKALEHYHKLLELVITEHKDLQEEINAQFFWGIVI